MEKTAETPVARYGNLVINAAQYASAKNHYIYANPDWRNDVRPAVMHRAGGKCEMCGATGTIAHHIIPITPANVRDRNITHNIANHVWLCRSCHMYIHGPSGQIDGLAKIKAHRDADAAEAAAEAAAKLPPPEYGYIDGQKMPIGEVIRLARVKAVREHNAIHAQSIG